MTYSPPKGVRLSCGPRLVTLRDGEGFVINVIESGHRPWRVQYWLDLKRTDAKTRLDCLRDPELCVAY